MKRDMELIRKLLLYVEEEHEQRSGIDSNKIEISNYGQSEIGYNILILADGGYLIVQQSSAVCDVHYQFRILQITWQGHELLDAIRDDGVWKKTQERLAPLGSVGIEMLKAVAVSVAKGMLGLG